MSNSPLLSIRNATISFAKKTLFEDLSLNLFAKDRVCLIGKNGVGKSTLMNIIVGQIALDEGSRWLMPGCSVGYLTQSPKVQDNISALNYIMGALQNDEHKQYLADIICDKLQIDPEALMGNLSGGQQRRVNLAKSLVLEPDILLLDEPTNHLDLPTIKWLEQYLKSYHGSLLIISHDRKFLENISNKVYWLRNGIIQVNNKGYGNFQEWSDSILAQEERELTNLQKKFELESAWLQTGVTARRKRNVGRLHYLSDLKAQLKTKRQLVFGAKNNIKISNQEIKDDSPSLIASFINVGKNFGDKNIFDKFNLKILRGEKIGVIGPNGSGKSTLIKMILGEMVVDNGKIKLAKDIAISYFDQQRIGIKPDLTIKNILCPSGSDYVQLANGKMRHICGYLKDFLFDPKDTSTLACTLSGGQQNRLLLAKTLANSGNFLILDEPTNDLDMDSLDMLQNFLSEYQGNLLVVSHDRDFLDNTVTSILAFEESGQLSYHLGGYSDYLEFKNAQNGKNGKDSADKKPQKDKNVAKNDLNGVKKPQKLSYKYVHELKKLPDKIAKLEIQIADLSAELSQTEDRNPANLALISQEIAQLQQKLDECENRWLELAEMSG
jgi:ABC transport system ATP-binding/permease protein